MIDIDGTICHTKNSNYENSTPNLGRIAKINALYDFGHEVHYWTARGSNSGKDWSELTTNQLNAWGCKYTTLNMNKPSYDVWVDDLAVNSSDFF